LTAHDPVIAAIVPCHNEAAAIEKVVRDLHRAVPGMDVYVYDNRSTDGTDEIARAAGAIVRYENLKGKGNVIRRAFGDIDADIYLLVDGDDTYEASAAPEMIELLLDGPYDHVLGVRKEIEDSSTAYRPGHAAGNKAFNQLVSRLFGLPVSDMLSGYRIFSRRFVKSFPAVSREFEIETELTIHSMTLRLPQAEFEVGFRDRPEGSESKLSTFKDGFKILSLIGHLIRYERPMAFHGIVGAVFAVIAVVLAVPVFVEYGQSGLVPRFPTAFLSASLMILAMLTWLVGLVLDGVTRARRETSRLTYLGYSAPARRVERAHLDPDVSTTGRQ
jgi:glycosyltransferase involved in cell wall biosynthesis